MPKKAKSIYSLKSIILKHILIVLAALAFLFLSPGCPSALLFGCSCPGCGLTRACLSALKLDFAGAFYYHPLFFIAIPAILYYIHAGRLKKLRLPKRAETAAGLIIAALFIGVWLYRLFVIKSPVLTSDFRESVIFKILGGKIL